MATTFSPKKEKDKIRMSNFSKKKYLMKIQLTQVEVYP